MASFTVSLYGPLYLFVTHSFGEMIRWCTHPRSITLDQCMNVYVQLVTGPHYYVNHLPH